MSGLAPARSWLLVQVSVALLSVTFTTRGVPGIDGNVLGSGVRCRFTLPLFSTCKTKQYSLILCNLKQRDKPMIINHNRKTEHTKSCSYSLQDNSTVVYIEKRRKKVGKIIKLLFNPLELIEHFVNEQRFIDHNTGFTNALGKYSHKKTTDAHISKQHSTAMQTMKLNN